MRLSAAALGPLVDVRVPRNGVVQSVFARAVNLRIGDELWTVLGHEGNDAALTIRLAPGQDVGMVAGRAGDSVHVRSGHVGVGSLVIDCRIAQRWTPHPYGPVARGANARASALEKDARGRAWAGSWQLAWDVTAALGSPGLRTREGLDDVVARTVGRGPGLTPAGDDVLVGVLAVLTSPAADPASSILVDRLRSALQPTLASTTDVSRALLEQAASGHPSRAVWDLVRGLLTGRAADDVIDPAVRVLGTGATSGGDTCAGIVAASRLMSRALEGIAA